MDFLGIGFAELFFIFIIALMVLGPRRLPEYAAKAGKIIRDLRNMSQGLMTEWQREIAVATRIEELEETRRELQEAQNALRETNQMIRSEAKQTAVETSAAVTQASKAMSGTPTTTNNQAKTVKQKEDAATQATPDPSADDLVEIAPGETPAPGGPASSVASTIEPPNAPETKPTNGSTQSTPSSILSSSESVNES